MALPKELDYLSKISALPANTKTISICSAPVNGSSFGSGSTIQFDLVTRGYLIPGTLCFRYTHAVTKSTEAGFIHGTPLYTPFSRMAVSIGSTVVEQIPDYNVVANLCVNSKMNYAQKAGAARAFGILDGSTDPTYANLNGGALAIGANTLNRAGPLFCVLSAAENLVPLNLLPGCRIELTVEDEANIFAKSTSGITAGTSIISNLELTYDVVEFGPEIDAVVRSMADENGNLTIKSQSFSTSTTAIPAASAGTLELNFNQRLSSIKSVFAHMACTNDDTAANSAKFGSKDVTKSTGSYQFNIGGEVYPPRPLNAANKAGMFVELAQAWSNGAHFVDAFNMAINPKEFGAVDNTSDNTQSGPGKFWPACNTERLSSSALLTGVSSQLSPISLRIVIPTATTKAHNCTLITCHDSLISINIPSRQCMIKQ